MLSNERLLVETWGGFLSSFAVASGGAAVLLLLLLLLPLRSPSMNVSNLRAKLRPAAFMLSLVISRVDWALPMPRLLTVVAAEAMDALESRFLLPLRLPGDPCLSGMTRRLKMDLSRLNTPLDLFGL